MFELMRHLKADYKRLCYLILRVTVIQEEEIFCHTLYLIKQSDTTMVEKLRIY